MVAEPAASGRPLPAALVAALARPGGGGTALLTDDRPGGVEDQVRAANGDRPLRVLPAAAASVLHAELAAFGRYRAIVVETANDKHRAGFFRNVFLHLEPGGVVWFTTLRETGTPPGQRAADPHLTPYLATLVAARGLDPDGVDWRRRDEIGMARAVGAVLIDEDELVVTDRDACFAKLREDEANRVLALRPDLGTVLAEQPALSFASRATIRHNATPYEPHHEVFAVPAMSLRSYDDVVARPGGVVVSGARIWPESYRHNQQGRLRQLQAPNRSHFFADLPDLGAPRPLPGSYFYLDSEYPGHFGHFVSEIVSRLWGWAPAKQSDPSLRALVSLPAGRSQLPGFCREIFAAAGIDPADVATFAADETVRPERLVGATPMLSMPDYVHPDLAGVWSTLREHLPRSPDLRVPDRIFIRRPEESIRVCHNEAEVVARFEAAGFVPVRPETLPLGDQAALFAEADVIAGFAGSAMLGLIYAPEPKRVILVGPESYTSNNEYLIASVLGHEIDHLGSRPEIAHPPGQWSREAFYSDYSFDPAREGVLLDEILAGLPRRRLGAGLAGRLGGGLAGRLRGRAGRRPPGPRTDRRPRT